MAQIMKICHTFVFVGGWWVFIVGGCDSCFRLQIAALQVPVLLACHGSQANESSKHNVPQQNSNSPPLPPQKKLELNSN